MRRLRPISTLYDTRFPSSTLFRSVADGRIVDAVGIRLEFVVAPAVAAEVMTPFRRIRTAGVVELVLPGRRALECPGVIAGDRRSIRGIAVLPSGTGHQLQHPQHAERAPRVSDRNSGV